MCGILSIISFKNRGIGKNLIDATQIIKHRGPDDEGFLTWSEGVSPIIFAGSDTSLSTSQHWKYPNITNDNSFKVGFGHRRLSILDLSPLGHQPMMLKQAGLAITYNGEVYNYLEIKQELIEKGHSFIGTSDTEVLLHAWQEWGVACLNKLNGMFAFVILDYTKNELYAVRDRFGVKPVYYYKGADHFYIASEIKQIRTSPEYKFNLNIPVARKFLAVGVSDYSTETFDTQIHHLAAGHYIHFKLNDVPQYSIKQWYKITPQYWKGSYLDAVSKYKDLLNEAVKLRLRADVRVGSCLSGGLDSSSIVCIAADILKKGGDFEGQETVTACYDDLKYDEWKFAKEVIDATNAIPHRTFPTFTELVSEVDNFLWYQDEPTGSTSTFSQWAVFKKTHEVGLKVMIDGQGADEQLAGYGGNDLANYAGLMRKLHLLSLADEVNSYKKQKGNLPIGFLIGALQLALGKGFQQILPTKYRFKIDTIPWLIGGEQNKLYDEPASSLQENLLRQIQGEPLPALLRFEDHNSMAWSVESRTPFLDYRLVEFTLGLPERFVYKRGIRKTILRDAMHGVIPEMIENRKDKMGFVTPEELWLKGEGRNWFLENIETACQLLGGQILDVKALREHVDNMIAGKTTFNFSVWRVVCFAKWYAMMTKYQ